MWGINKLKNTGVMATAILGALLFGQAVCFGGTVEWLDTFDDPGGIWYAENAVWAEGVPSSGPGAAYEGSNCAGTVLGGNYPATANSRFIRFNSFVVPTNNPRLNYWSWHSFSTSDSGYVEVQVDGSGTWERVSPICRYSGSGVWSPSSVDLSDYAGDTIQAAFHFIAIDASVYGPDNNSGWYIDNVSLESGDYFFETDGFESGMGDWYAECGTWEFGSGSFPSASNGFATALGWNYSANTDSRLASPPFVVPDRCKNPRVRFSSWHSFSTSDKGYIEIRIHGSETWSKVSSDYTYGGNGWGLGFVDLSDYAEETIQVAFHFIAVDGSPYGADTSNGWFIDNVSIETGSLVFQNPEGLEEGWGDWHASRSMWEVGVPSSGPGSAYSGTNCVATKLSGNYAATVNSQLVSPWFAMPSTGAPFVGFHHWYSFSHSDKGYVEIQMLGESVFNKVSSDYVNSSGGWSFGLIDLGDYRGRVVRVAFHFIAIDGSPYGSDTSSGWYIDDISLPQYAGVHFDDIVTRTSVGTNICVTGYSSPGATNLEFTLMLPQGDYTGVDLVPPPGRFETFSITPQGSGEWLVLATTTSTNALGAFEPIGDLQFTGIAPHSKFTKADGHSVSAVKSDGSSMTYTGIIWPGKVVLIANEPLMELAGTASQELDFTLYGIASTDYEIQESPELMEPTWTSINTVTAGADLTTTWGPVAAPSNSAFFRAVEQ